ncbi:glycosyl hydrolase family 18 protein [Portibacter marinus]|uniref:glycosyl hydrolase family 18 protein n=1 Tax=Portibacter marinus TaxID=2898660 RepID=UPI001F2C3305|nr:glycosyl hydrolase family 18 protein [Portibacter marinus]
MRIIIALLLLFLYANGEAQNPKRIVGYVMGSRIDTTSERIAVEKLTHVNYAFADVVNDQVVEINDSDSSHLAYLNSLKKYNPDLKLLVSVGGWTRSGGFSDAVVSDESRETFANSAVEFLIKHRLDGIDLDWEYPGQAGNGNTFRPEDKENFTKALRLLRQKLDAKGKEDQTHYLLTIASAAGQRYLDHVEMAEIAKVLDFINIMTYDYFGAWSTHTGNHSRLYPNSHEAVQQHIAAGVPRGNLNLGVAFYGRGWIGVEGVGEEVSKASISMGFGSISDSLDAGYTESWDTSFMAPFAWKASTKSLIGYDNPNSLEVKADYVADQDLGGIMFWEYHGDDHGRLLNTIYAKFHTIPGHAHNDYEKEQPLTKALDLGFKSIEVDIHLIKGELYVSHGRPTRLDSSQTLESMYLKPLKSIPFIQSPLFLLIDVKTNADKTYERLAEILPEYQLENVKFIISGNRAIDRIAADRIMYLDGRPDDLKGDFTSEQMPLISQNYNQFFSSRKVQNIDIKEKKVFKDFIQKAHSKGIYVRLWAAPDHPEMWDFLRSMDVDLINTDQPEVFYDYYWEKRK